MQMKRIVFLHPHFTISGGAGRFVLEMGKLLSKKGYEIIVISIRTENNIVGSYKKYIKFINIDGPLSSSIWFWILFLSSYFKVAKILNEHDNFILFPQVFPANWWGFIYKIFHPKIKLIWMCQEPSAFIHSKEWINSLPKSKQILAKVVGPIFSFFDKSLAKKADLVLANSEYTRGYAKKIYNFSNNRIKTLYLGVDSQQFRPNNKVKRKNQILSVGRITKFKNLNLVIQAVKILQERHIKFKLFVIGEGEEKENLVALTKKLNLDNEIVFTNSISDKKLIKYYQSSKALILCSESEPFGLVAVEAMAAGLPVVAFQSGGPAETVIHDKTGFLIEKNNLTSLINKITELLSNVKLFNNLSRNSVIRAKEFSWIKTVQNLESFLKLL
jgi:glycosyltransferase involved in cell wall biosynthesis